MNCKLASLEEERLVYLSDSHTRIKGYPTILVGDFRRTDDGEGGSEIYLPFLS